MNRSQSTLVLIDSSVENYQSFVSGAHAGAEVLVLDAAQDGIEQITQAIADRQPEGLDQVHIVSHGRSGELRLGSAVLNSATLSSYAQQMQSWAEGLAANAEILLYGCKVAAGEAGRGLVQRISQLTGAVVAASADLTGNAELGGNWNLEYATGSLTSPLAFRQEVLNAYPGVLAVLLNETFREADVVDKPWLFGIGGNTTSALPFLTARPIATPSPNGLPGSATPIDASGSGALRLTGAANDQATFVIYNRPISASDGITVTFDLFAYGGTPLDGRNGDGLSFFVINGNASPTTGGAFGGSLGYAQKLVQGIPGVAGGYLGVGYDEFGNFSTSLETGALQRPTPAGVAVAVPDSIGIRGSAASQYAYLGGTGTLPLGVDNPAATRREDAQRRTRIDLDPTGILTVRVDLNDDNDFLDPGEVVINNFNVTPINGALPSSFKFGFAASTGDATNIHEVRNLVVRTFVRPEVPIDPINPVVDPDLVTDNCRPGRRIAGDSQNNRLRGTRNSDRLIGYAGNDLLQGRGCNDRLFGGRGNDRLFGNGGRDTLRGQQGNDRMFGQRGRDRMHGGLGNDVLDGGDDADTILGGRGRDRLLGRKGSDNLDGGRGDDRIKGGLSSDSLHGRQDNDIVQGNSGNDIIRGGLGRDRLGGNRKRDVVIGGRGGDSLYGSGGGDRLDGGLGSDRLDGGTQADVLLGGAGNDALIGGGGADTMTGGAGNDRYVYRSEKERGDLITGFTASRRSPSFDQIDLRRLVSKPGYNSNNPFQKYVRLAQSGLNTIVRFDFNGNSVGGFQSLATLNNVTASSVNASNFVF